MRRRCLVLLEVVLGLVLLATLAVWLLNVEAQAVQQTHRAEQRAHVAAATEALLNEWSLAGVPVTLPATGRLMEHYTWQRSAQPVRVAGLLATQISVVIRADADGREAYRVDWWLGPRKGGAP